MNGFAQKVDPIWNEPVSTGSAGALARLSVRSTLNLKPLNAVTVSRFALIAGEGARAPSISLSLSAIPLFGQGHLKYSHPGLAIAVESKLSYTPTRTK